jgi:hypothetical protein
MYKIIFDFITSAKLLSSNNLIESKYL